MRGMRRALQGLAIVGTMVLTSPAEAREAPRLAAIFADHAVLQRDRPISVWGTGAAGARLTVDLGGQTVRTTAGADGRWRALLPARGAGGPFTLKVVDADGAGDEAGDVLVGDVWLCSGQSNMELQVSRTLNGPSVIGSANDPALRLLTVAKDFDPAPQAEFRNPVSWAPAGPEAVGNFSATCYYFGHDLRRDHEVPMGLINASWGGSNIETWMSGEALERAGEGRRLSILSRLASDPVAAQADWGGQWQAWWGGQASDTPWSPADAGPWTAVPAMAPWERWGVPELAVYNGMVWFRLDIDLTAAQAGEARTLSLGNVDEADQTWINGVAVGASGSGDRLYQLPRGLLKAGSNTIVVNAYDTWEVGGLYGPAEKRALILANGESVPLDPAGWRYRAATNVGIAPPRAPWSSTSGLTTIGNAMIAPLHDYGLKGALWYQGESNTGEGLRYRDLLAGLMADWRARFGAEDLPFLIVQLANFGQPPTAPGPSGWAELRESQRRAVAADDHAGLAVAIDLGDRWDIHPAQKQELGRRLARAARHVVYGDPAPPSGPTPTSVERIGDEIVIAFADVTGELRTLSGAQIVGLELCVTGDDCRYAAATASGRTVRIPAQAGEQIGEVRFCWADSPVCNLYDAAGLPAGPFRERVGFRSPPGSD